VHPEWHGKGVGKRLLLRAVDEAVRLGVPYVSLHTWAGNERALPLYKKTGFFWIPGTDVRMENYLPLILRLPWAEGLLEGAHWYGCLRREITLEEDREEWRGREVFRYRLEKAGKALEVVIDRAAQSPCAIYAPDLSAELWPAPDEPCAVLPFRLCWRLVNRGEAPLTVGLAVRGDPGVAAAGGELITLEPGERREGEFPCRTASDLRVEPRRPAPAARLGLLLPRGEVELACGLKPRLPIEVSFGPAPPIIPPETPRRLVLSLTNRHHTRLQGALTLAPKQGVNVSPSRWEFDLSPEGTQVLEVALSARAGGHALGGRVELSSRDSWELPPLPLLVRGPGEVAACRLRDEILVAGEGFYLLARARGGRLVFFRPEEAHPLLRQGEELGPPFFPGDLGQRRWQLHLSQGPEGAEILLQVESRRLPGIRLEKRVSVSSGPWVEITYRASSQAKGPASLQLRPTQWDLPDLPWKIAFLAEQGLVEDQLGGFPQGETDFPKRMAEDWLALEGEGFVLGFLPQGEVEWDCSWGWSWKTTPVELSPGGTASLHRYFIHLGPGDFRGVRAAWAARQGVSPKGEEPRPLVWVETAGPFLIGDQGELSVAVKTVRGQPFTGKLCLVPPAGLRVSPRELAVSEVTPARPATFKIAWEREGPGRAGLGELVLRGMGEERRFPLPMIFLPKAPPKVTAEVKEDQQVFTISADESTIQVAPGFCAAVFSWQDAGGEWLLSAFPEARSFVWLSPWFGGIYPILYELSLEEWDWPGRLFRECFQGEAWQGELAGVPLAGVRLTCRPEGEGLAGLALEVLYATPGPGLLLSALKIKNQGRPRRLAGGFLGFLSPGGVHRDTVLNTPGRTRIPSPYHAWYDAPGWGLVQAPGGEGVLALAPPEGKIGTWDAGEAGRHLTLEQAFPLRTGEEKTVWGWWVILQPGEDHAPWLALPRWLPPSE
ncbi:GNAT family N-acetyltransferase, partial [Candidatus Bipolaricaulota bacterium]|nr:GNAT family N-acetyltransferase [Candidatus Bipolaricaulota bacterium]